MVQHGPDRVQISPWKASTTTATVVPFPGNNCLERDTVVELMANLVQQGYTATYTAAISPMMAEPFLAEGFGLVEELHLMRRPLDDESPIERGRLRRGRRSDHEEVLGFDRLAFDEFWQFDRSNLIDAMRATPRHRFVVSRTSPVVGYHVTGLANTNAYVQRVAVDPAMHGQGWGTTLVQDALHWAWRNGARTAHVNTQVSNKAARSLYEKSGFAMADYRLQVLHRHL